jgi:hypothetical protein
MRTINIFKWAFLAIALISLAFAIYFLNSERKILARNSADLLPNTIKQMNLSRNDNIWYQIHADFSEETTLNVGGFQMNLIHYSALKNINMKCIVDDLGEITIIARRAIIDAQMNQLRLQTPAQISSPNGLRGLISHADINLQSGEITIKNAQWTVNGRQFRMIEQTWHLKRKTRLILLRRGQ